MPRISVTKLRHNRRAAQAGSQTVSRVEWAVWLTASTTVFGTAAWCAGEAYVSGYWGAVGLTPGAVAYSLQELTFMGFVGNFSNWLWMLLFYAFTWLYILFLEFLSTVKTRRSSQPGGLRLWLRKRFAKFERHSVIDPDIKRMCAIMLMASCGLVGLVVIPLGVWVVAAEKEGHDLMVRQVCQVRNTLKLPTTVSLSDGRKLVGKYLARSDKIGVFIDRTSIYNIQFGEKTALQDASDVTTLICKR